MATITIVSPAPQSRVSGVVEITARVSGGTPSGPVRIVIGMPEYGNKTATKVSSTDWTVSWDTRKKLMDPSTPSPADALFWVTATAVVSGQTISAPYVPVFTANKPVSAPVGGWRSALSWSANYASSYWWKRSQFAVIGDDYASVMSDPLKSGRPVLAASVPDSARWDSDQPNTTTVRFQSSSTRNIREGDEFCVGFSLLIGDDFPTVYPANDPANRAGPAATGYISMFQFYGPPYEQGAALVLHANRISSGDPLDEFVIRGNELNPGDPWPLLSIPYNRNRWTDIVFKIHASSSIEKGWIEMYVNQGDSTSVQPVPFVNGITRIPRVLLRSNSGDHRTDMQIYRVAGRISNVRAAHTGHTIGRSVEDVDPGSYR